MSDLLTRLSTKVLRSIGKLQGNLIEAFWYIKEINAGDLVTPYLLRQYGFTPVHSYPDRAQLIACGSLMKHVTKDYSGYVLGTGFLRDGPSVSIPLEKVLAVRGTLTRDRIGASKNLPLGDPGLLMATFYKEREPKKFTLGIIPHIVDKENTGMKQLIMHNPGDVHFIDIQQSVEKVMREISQCEYVLSSSLHGIVFSDSLGIPCLWMDVPERIEERKFKYADYNSVFNRTLSPTIFNGDEKLNDILRFSTHPPQDQLIEVTQKLDQAFHTLHREVLGR